MAKAETTSSVKETVRNTIIWEKRGTNVVQVWYTSPLHSRSRAAEGGLLPGLLAVMGIDFQRHSWVGVPQEMLDLLDVHASLKAPGRIGVPQYMGRYLLVGQYKVASPFLWNHRTAATGYWPYTAFSLHHAGSLP